MKKICSSYINCNEEKKVLFEKKGYPILECEKCSHKFTKIADHDEHLNEIYSDEYFFAGKEGYPNYLDQQDLLCAHGRRYAKLLSKYTKRGRVLDVGCAAGFILKGFEQSGWECYGIEPNETMAAYGREHLHLRIEANNIENFSTDKKFDLINIIQVIGHVYDPDQTLQNVSCLLNKNGLVLVESWNRNSLSARILGKRWHEYSPPSVIHWYSDKTLTELFNYHGFKLIAKGHPVKRISVEHALSFLEAKRPLRYFKKGIQAMRRLSGKLTMINPFFDVKWYVFQKNSNCHQLFLAILLLNIYSSAV